MSVASDLHKLINSPELHNSRHKNVIVKLEEVLAKVTTILSETGVPPEALFDRDWSEDLGLLKYRLAEKYGTPSLVHLDLWDDRVAKEARITLKECLKIRNARGAVAALNITLKDICKLDTAAIQRSTEKFGAAELLNKHHLDGDRVLQYTKESFIHPRGLASAWILQLWSPRFID